MTPWGEDYVNLALRVEKHFEGFVDAYCGPQEVKARIDKEEKRPLTELYDDAESLAHTVPSEDEPRKVFLKKQITGIQTTIQILQGEEIDYVKQVELFFDIKPEKVPDSLFEKQKQVLQDIFKREDLAEVLEEWRKKREVPEQLLQKSLTVLSEECQRRTGELLPLPEKEQVDFVLVTDKPWSGYNWYLGNYKSRVEINTDTPIYSTGLPSLVSHEAYPGHHTEHSIKEQVLYQEKGFFEACVFVYNTPECLISEGIANVGLELIFGERAEAYRVLKERLKVPLDVERDAAVAEALTRLAPCSGNASLMLHKENAEPAEAIEYLIDVGLSTKERAEKQVQFMTNPLFQAYIFNYYAGKDLVSEALKTMDFRIFYEHQICPSNLQYFRTRPSGTR
ncbi:MAG: hypothetical protein HXS46_01330 [Theionarchaea archaeon]|nr:MAG: hypothetical protein AYK18_01890 [Theionarchaea archaeon DG-70]MBU7009303.1 hypothetical protein [Theionarchaea archaeon]